MNEFTIVTLISRPVDEVFSVVQDLAKAPLWTPGLTEARQTSDGPMETGATMMHAGTFLGRKYETEAVCTDWTENKRYATKSTSGPFYIEMDTAVEPVATGTRMTNLFRGESRGFFKFAEPIVVRLTKRHFETAAENLRTLMEDGAL
jgi:ribosome-associated toxin RatA of RatAB toxin-antitoxin module